MATKSPWPTAPMPVNAPPGGGSGPFMPPPTTPQPMGALPDLYGGFAGGVGSGGTAPMGGIDLYQPAGAKDGTPPMAFDQLLGGGSGPFMPPGGAPAPTILPSPGPQTLQAPAMPTTQTATGQPATGQTATGQPAGGWQTSPITDMSVGGFQNWAQQTFGYQYSPQELQQIAQEVGYSGSGPISGEQMASAQQAAMNRARERGWRPESGPPLTVDDAPVFDAPELELPTDPAPELNLPDRYTGPGEFRAPTLEEMQVDPGYQFRLQEGERAMRNAASALGGTRGINHLVDLLRYGQDMGSQEYGNVYARAGDTFERNRRTGLDVYDRGRQASLDEYGAGLDIYDRNRDDARTRFDAAFRGAEAEYAPRYDTWTARNRANELNLEDRWRRDVYSSDDAWRRDRAGEDDRRYREEADWRSRVYGDTRRDRMTDEQWRQYLADEDRRRFLVGNGY